MKSISKLLAVLCDVLTLASAPAADKKPNILVLWDDDIGYPRSIGIPKLLITIR